MAYATLRNIIERYGEDDLLTAADRDGDDQLDSAAVDRALSDASAEIDTYLATRYALPVPYIPEILKRLCVDITLYRLAFNAVGNSEERRRRYEDAVALLVRISKGDVSLGLGVQATPRSKGSGVVINGPGRRFSRDTMEGL